MTLPEGFSISPSAATGLETCTDAQLAQGSADPVAGISAVLPAGMTAKLRDVQRCEEAQIAAEACPGGSQIGIVAVKAGPGGSPFDLSGPVYLTNGYNGGAFGMVAIIRVVALAADNARGLCEKADAWRDACPKESIIGDATAITPILGQSLKGNVYFVKGERTDAKTGDAKLNLRGSVRFVGQNGAKPAAAKPSIGTACQAARNASSK